MKLYVTVNRPVPSGYIGIDLATQQVNFEDMDSICEAAECTEIIIDQLFSYVTIEKLGSLLQQILSRLRARGKVIIRDVDFDEIMKSYMNGRLNIQDMNYLLYGQGKLNKCGSYSISNIRSVTEQMGLETVSTQLDAGYYTLIAQRN